MSVLTPLEAAVLAQIDEAELVELTSDLIRIESLGGNESPAQRRVAEHMGAFGLDTDVWQIDLGALSRHPGFSMEIDRSEGVGVVGSMGEGDGPALMLNGHVDVVPPGVLELWTSPPFEPRVENGFLYGRGALDMKGGLACGLVAAAAIRRAGARLSGRLLVSSVIGEEDGGVGTLASIERGYRADGAVVMEPTRLSVAAAQAGCSNFRIRVRGRAAHGALRTEGVSALEKLFPILQAIEKLEVRRNRDPGPGFDEHELPFAISIGRVEGGSWASSVPEEVTVEGRYGLRVGEPPEDARRELEDAVSSAADADPWLREHPPEVEWWGGRFHAARTPIDAEVVTSLLSAHRDQGSDPTRISAVTYGADMGLLVEHGGIPAVLYGPGDVRLAHRPDEAVPIAELVVAARTLALTALRFCGVES